MRGMLACTTRVLGFAQLTSRTCLLPQHTTADNLSPKFGEGPSLALHPKATKLKKPRNQPATAPPPSAKPSRSAHSAHKLDIPRPALAQHPLSAGGARPGHPSGDLDLQTPIGQGSALAIDASLIPEEERVERLEILHTTRTELGVLAVVFSCGAPLGGCWAEGSISIDERRCPPVVEATHTS